MYRTRPSHRRKLLFLARVNKSLRSYTKLYFEFSIFFSAPSNPMWLQWIWYHYDRSKWVSNIIIFSATKRAYYLSRWSRGFDVDIYCCCYFFRRKQIKKKQKTKYMNNALITFSHTKYDLYREHSSSSAAFLLLGMIVWTMRNIYE